MDHTDFRTEEFRIHINYHVIVLYLIFVSVVEIYVRSCEMIIS